jgi:hypothetical protein
VEIISHVAWTLRVFDGRDDSAFSVCIGKGFWGYFLHRLARAVKAGSGFGAFSAFSARSRHPRSDI